MIKTSTNKIFIMERSILTDRNVFAHLLYESGKLSKLEWELYNNWYNWLIETFKYIIPTHFIYLKINSDIAHKRIKLRNRLEEQNISLTYLDQLNIKYNEWLHDKNVFVIDASKDIDINIKLIEKYINVYI